MEYQFLADVHLGKLARLLRMLGFDTLYKNDYTISDLLTIGAAQERTVLSRNISIAKETKTSLIITGEDPLAQLKQVVEYFHLKDHVHLFSRCLVCNGILETVSKESIGHLLPENTRRYFNEFRQCANCKRFYWKGSHYERMTDTIEKFIIE